jgi:hypothetical protein
MTSGRQADIDHIGNNNFIVILDDIGFPGNWLIRAEAGDGSDNKHSPGTYGDGKAKPG